MNKYRKQGVKISRTGLAQMLRNEKYHGMVRFKRRKKIRQKTATSTFIASNNIPLLRCIYARQGCCYISLA